jgi:predicted small secreted protein
MKMMRLHYSVVLACLLAGCATQTGLQRQIKVLRSGSFGKSRQASKVVLADSRFSYGVSMQDIIGILGNPDFRTKDGNDICYTTGGGPLWLTFQDDELIKKAIVSPPHWRGTDAELAELWEQKRRTGTWYQW